MSFDSSVHHHPPPTMSSDSSKKRFLSYPLTLTYAQRGKNVITAPILTKIFKTLTRFGEDGSILKEEEGGFTPFYSDEKGAVSCGSIILVSKDLETQPKNSELLSNLFSYEYDTFNPEKDTSDTIKEKVNAFIKNKIYGGKGNNVPKFNICIHPDHTNLIMASFFKIQLNWGYLNVSKKSLKFYSANAAAEGTMVDGFRIPEVRSCAARIYINNNGKHYLLVRIPVNSLRRYGSPPPPPPPQKRRKNNDEDKENFIEPWNHDPDGGSRLENINQDYLYLTMVTKVSPPSNNNNNYKLADTELDENPQELCNVGEKLIAKSLRKKT